MMEVWHGIVRPEHINNNKYLDHLNTYIQTHTSTCTRTRAYTNKVTFLEYPKLFHVVCPEFVKLIVPCSFHPNWPLPHTSHRSLRSRLWMPPRRQQLQELSLRLKTMNQESILTKDVYNAYIYLLFGVYLICGWCACVRVDCMRTCAWVEWLI